MATSSILGGDTAPTWPRGSDVASLGPSDSTDSGSDARGGFDLDELSSDTDAEGTGERSSVDPHNVRSDADILPDHIEGMPALDMALAFDNGEGEEPATMEDIDHSEISTLAAPDEMLDSADAEEPED